MKQNTLLQISTAILPYLSSQVGLNKLRAPEEKSIPLPTNHFLNGCQRRRITDFKGFRLQLQEKRFNRFLDAATLAMPVETILYLSLVIPRPDCSPAVIPSTCHINKPNLPSVKHRLKMSICVCFFLPCPSVCLDVCLHLSVCLPAHHVRRFVCLSVRLSSYLPYPARIYVSVLLPCPSVCLSSYPGHLPLCLLTMSVCLFVCLFCLSVCLMHVLLPTCLSVCLSNCLLSACLSVWLSALLPACLSVSHLSACLSSYPVNLFLCLSAFACLSVFLPTLLVPSLCLSVCLPTLPCPCVCLSSYRAHLSVCLSVCLYVCLSCLSVFLPCHLSFCLPCPFVSLFVFLLTLSVSLSVCLPTLLCPFICLTSYHAHLSTLYVCLPTLLFCLFVYPVRLSVFLPDPVSVCLPCLSPCLSTLSCPFVCLSSCHACLSVCLPCRSVCFCLLTLPDFCLSILSVYMSVNLSSYPTHLPVCLPTMSVCLPPMSVCMSVCLPTLPACVFVYPAPLSISLYVCLPCLSPCLPVFRSCTSASLSVCLPTLLICLSIFLSCPSVCLTSYPAQMSICLLTLPVCLFVLLWV